MLSRYPAVALAAALYCLSVEAAEVVPPEIEQPGTQPQEAGNFETPDRCDNCHAGYDDLQPEHEPATGWRGGAMGNAGRDPIFWATLAIAEQDFDGSGDLCIRCHSAAGWYGGRSTPTDGSGLQSGDDDGVDCDTCHVMTNPDNTEHLGIMNSPYVANCDADPNVPDKCSVSGQAGDGFYGSGMLSVWPGSDKLGPYDDAEARHQFMQSRFHRSVDFCGTCHDVSNPAVADLAPGNGAQPGAPHVVSSRDFTADGRPDLGGPVEQKAAFNNPPYAHGIVERTFSEYKASALPTTLVAEFATALPADLQIPGGSFYETYQAALLAGTGGHYEDGTPRYFSCQSCHMRPVEAYGANKKGVRLRRDLPMHDHTGGNYWVADVIEYQDARDQLRLGGGLSAVQTFAMELGQLRSVRHLEQAADLVVTGDVLRVVNLTGHKLISGYPEGRRMWLNIKWYGEGGALLREDGAYGPIGLTIPNPAGGADAEVESSIDLDDPNLVIYEAHYAMTREWADLLVNDVGYPADLVLGYDRSTAGTADYTLGDLVAQAPGTYHETFHFVLNDRVSSDNRIPPFGMRYDEARIRNALPVPADQYGGGEDGSIYNYWDEIDLAALRPAGAVSARIDLLYQGTSWEYIQFLANNNDGQSAFLGLEGANLLEAWINAEIDVPQVLEVGGDRRMVPPVLMKTVTWGDTGGNTAPVAAGDSYEVEQDASLSVPTPGVLGNDSDADGDVLTAELVTASTHGSVALFGDGSFEYTPAAGFTGHDSFTYLARDTAGAASGPATVVVSVLPVGGANTVAAESVTTGLIVGKGNSETFVAQGSFLQGDEVVLRILVRDGNGSPIEGAIVALLISGPETADLTSSGSGPDGVAEARWKTSAPRRNGQGGTATGDYVATTISITADGYTWDGVPTSAAFVVTQ
jgi:hypothetical protein